MCASAAPMTDAVAAIADPPQIAVPLESSVVSLASILSSLPSAIPNANVPTIVPAANANPISPASPTCRRSIPSPSITTATWIMYLAIFDASFVCDVHPSSASTTPIPSARGGEIHGSKHAAAPTHITTNRQSTPDFGAVVGADGVELPDIGGQVYEVTTTFAALYLSPPRRSLDQHAEVRRGRTVERGGGVVSFAPRIRDFSANLIGTPANLCELD